MSKVISFSTIPVTSQVFYKGKHSFLFVNIKPLLDGHILVSPYRVVPRLKDLTLQESVDLFETVLEMNKFIEYVYKLDATNISLQDGLLLGQSIPHVHFHIMPRKFSDKLGDSIYPMLESHELELKDVYEKFEYPEVREPRTMDQMVLEADWFKLEYNKFKQLI